MIFFPLYNFPSETPSPQCRVLLYEKQTASSVFFFKLEGRGGENFRSVSDEGERKFVRSRKGNSKKREKVLPHDSRMRGRGKPKIDCNHDE